jgi:ketosteroid isomerase-like protein
MNPSSTPLPQLLQRQLFPSSYSTQWLSAGRDRRYAHGWDEVSTTIERAASQFRDGRLVSVEIVEKQVTPEFAYTLWLEHAEGKVGAREDIATSTLRVTTIYRPEEGTWKVVHRHADPITTPQPAETVIQE